MAVCPYCRSAVADSRDHIFSEALGGHRRIRACGDCNHRFGHDFEARALGDVGKLRLMLGLCGVPTPENLVWRRAVFHQGAYYDLGADSRLRLTTPIKQLDDSGRLLRITFPTLADAERAARRMREKGRAERVEVSYFHGTLPDDYVFTVAWAIGDDLRRMAVKMCVALARLAGFDSAVDVTLLDALKPEAPPPQDVRLDLRTTEPDPPEWPKVLGHFIYVEGNPQAGVVRGFVRLFGVVQLDLILSSSYSGSSQAHLGVLDLMSGRETFNAVTLFGRDRVPRFVDREWDAFQRKQILRRLDELVFNATGRNDYRFTPRASED